MLRFSERFCLRSIIPAIGFAGMLAGCSSPDFYLDRRDTISFGAGDAVATNIITQTVDPWPRAAANRNIESNGERMQAAVERYRQNKVTPLKFLATSSVEFTPTNSESSTPATSK
jgi:hypothetical protein